MAPFAERTNAQDEQTQTQNVSNASDVLAEQEMLGQDSNLICMYASCGPLVGAGAHPFAPIGFRLWGSIRARAKQRGACGWAAWEASKLWLVRRWRDNTTSGREQSWAGGQLERNHSLRFSRHYRLVAPEFVCKLMNSCPASSFQRARAGAGRPEPAADKLKRDSRLFDLGG